MFLRKLLKFEVIFKKIVELINCIIMTNFLNSLFVKCN